MGLFDQKKHRGEVARAYNLFERTRDPALLRAAQIRNSRRWRTVRAWYITQHPFCEDPFSKHAGGVPVLAMDVHHITPLIVAPDLAYKESNLMALCRECHALIEARTPREPIEQREGKGG